MWRNRPPKRSLERRVERLLAGVPERRVTRVVAEPDRLDEILVQREGPGDDAGDAGRLERVGHPRPVVVAGRVDEDLRLALQPAERLGVDDPVAVALERRPHAGSRRSGLQPPARLVGTDGERRERTAPRRADPIVEGVGYQDFGDGHRLSVSPSPDLPVGRPERSDDDRDGAAVDAPGRAGDVARPVGAEEDDHGCDLLGSREAAERPARADLREHLVPVSLLVGEAAVAEPGVASRSAPA